jgi:nitrous oxidase accessory protein NosD
VSYTLRGRLETRLAVTALPLLAAAALAAGLGEWWPVELAGLMIAVGVVVDLALYHRLLPYQAGWLAVPLGLVELAAVVALSLALRLDAPLRPALAFYAASWLWAQVLVHAALPRLRLTYGEDGGELGRAGAAAPALALALFAFAGGVAWANRPPTVHLSAGVHRGPLVIDRREHLVGEPGAVVRGGIVVRSSGVKISNVTVFGGDYGFDVEKAQDVSLDHVVVGGAHLDGIHVRRSTVSIRDCTVDTATEYGQGIDISFAFDLPPSTVEGCRVRGGQEGIVTHFANAHLLGNTITGTSMRAITMTEMSMGDVSANVVGGALGVGIFCGDHSECMIDRNVVTGTRPDVASGDRARDGYGIVAHYGATAELADNRAGRVGAFAEGRIEPMPLP